MPNSEIFDNLSVVYEDVDSLVPYARNAKEHPKEQVDQIARSMREFGNCDPVAVWTNADGRPEIVEGHGRVLALKQLGAKRVPCIYLDHLTDEQRRAYTHVHNQTTLNSGFDLDVLMLDIEELGQYDWAGFGFDSQDAINDIEEENPYTAKIETPVYEIKGENPSVDELYDVTHTSLLIGEIDSTDGVPNDVKEFLRAAAYRHVAFNYGKVAEYYAHAPANIQRLMEQSALVIIDFDRALELGYVRMTTKLQEIVDGVFDGD